MSIVIPNYYYHFLYSSTLTFSLIYDIIIIINDITSILLILLSKETMYEKHDILIIGATFTGLGIAHRNPGSVIVESSICPGPEFIYAIKPGTNWEREPRTDAAADLLGKIKQHGILDDNKIHIPALAPVICDWSIANGFNLKMATVVMAVKPLNAGFKVTLFDIGGSREVIANRIIDTRTSFASTTLIAGKGVILQKRLNALLHSDNARIKSGEYRDIEIREGCFPSESVAMFRLNLNCDWPEARSSFHSSWSKRPAILKEWKIAALATQFDIKAPRGPFKISENWIHMPSQAYDNPVEAYDYGYMSDFTGDK